MNARALVNLPNFLTVLRIALTPLFLIMLFAETW
jgi:phosphatidylglycerophosphate synthase